jgi:hypothetical protein
MIIKTGRGGYELLQEAFEEKGSSRKRIYIGKKVMRILRAAKGTIRKSSLSGRYYRLVKM